ncbi:MAG TPA: hypothetical protein VI197_00935, partial [Polyangiaceae bacterium]
LLRLLGSEQALALLESTAEELFQRLGIQVDVAPVSEELPQASEPPLAIATIEITPPLCRIVIVDGGSGAELDRRSFSESSVETAVEAAAHIAYFVVETRLAEADRASAPAPAPAPAAQPQPAPSSPAVAPVPPTPGAAVATIAEPEEHETVSPGERGSVGVDLGLTFSVVSLGSGRVRPGSGLTGEIRFPSLGVPLGVLLAATTHAASDLEFQGASAELRPSVLRLLATLDLPLGSALAFAFGAGGGVEWLRLTPTASADGVQVSGAESMFEGLLTGVAGLRIKLAERAFLSAFGGVDVGLNPKTFTANTAAGQEVLLHMPSVRPVMLLGAAASLDQSPRFSAAEAR